MKKPLTPFGGDSTIPAEWKSFCQQEKPQLNPQQIYDAFRDYWVSTGESKRDWNLTWRSWVRRENVYQKKRIVKPVHPKYSELAYEESTAL